VEPELEEVLLPNRDGTLSAIRRFRNPTLLAAANEAIARDFRDSSKIGVMVYANEQKQFVGGIFFRLGDHITFTAAGLVEKGRPIQGEAKLIAQF